MNPLLGGFVLFVLTSAGSYDPVETFPFKHQCDTAAFQARLKLMKTVRLDTDGYYRENGMPAYLCIGQRMHFPPKK